VRSGLEVKGLIRSLLTRPCRADRSPSCPVLEV
jgi:hypothetical protein